MSARALGLAAGLALVACACAGPRAPLEVGSKEIPIDVDFGRPDPPARPPNLNPSPVGFPGFIEPPLPPVQPGGPLIPPPLAEACPRADPLSSPTLVARLTAPVPPVEATYVFRNAGSFQIGDGAEQSYPPTSERRVHGVRTHDEGAFEFQVTTRLGTDTTTTTYRVVNAGPDRGVFLASVVTERAGGADAFVPLTPILLLPFPSDDPGTGLEDEVEGAVGREYRSSGTDPLTQTTMVVEARIADTKTRVDACGAWIDGYEVEVLQGRIVAPAKQLSFSGRIVIATQYGALVTEDEIQLSGLDGFEQLDSRNRARITRVPLDPAGA